MSYVKLITVVGVVVIVSIRCTTEATPSNDEREIRETRSMSNKAIAEHDTAALVQSWTPDYHLVSSRNLQVAGRTENTRNIQTNFDAIPDVIYIRTPGSIDIYSDWKMAGETGTWVGRWTDRGDQIELRGTYFAKWHQVDGRWLIRAEIFVPLSCSGGAYCDKGPI